MNLKSKVALAALALTAGTSAFAQLAYNVGVVSEYRYRGLEQTDGSPAVQGGVDYAHSSGLYVGTWATNISWIKDSGASKGNLELDLYGGYKGELGPVGYDVGYLRYEYVANKLGDVAGFVNPNTDEAYVGLSYGPVAFKYSYAFSNLFGTVDSKGSTYADLSATFDIGAGFSLTPHVGVQDIKNNTVGASYIDYALTLGKDFGGGYSGTLQYVSVDAVGGTSTVYPKAGKDRVILGVKYSF